MRGLQVQDPQTTPSSGFLELWMTMKCHHACSNVSAISFILLSKGEVFRV